MAKRPGRPKMEGPKREFGFRFLTTKAETSKIKARAKASGLTVSEYLRRVALGGEEK
jgi:hypothetical protein